MNLEQLQESDQIIFECVAGSTAYNLNNKDSDVDIRGIFKVPNEDFMSLDEPPKQISCSTNDTTYYELKRFVQLASNMNPNIVELLFMPKQFINCSSPVMDLLIKNRGVFISKKAYSTFSGYAYSQIKRAKGQNKWVNNPKPKELPNKEDYCYFVFYESGGFQERYRTELTDELKMFTLEVLKDFPGRPHTFPVGDGVPDLDQCHVAKLEHVPNVYRLYDYSDCEDVKGVFKNNVIVCQSIPKEDEWERMIGYFTFNEMGYVKDCKDHKNYWDWIKNRNEARYRAQEAGEVDYDAKNIAHCFRLLWSGQNILEHGEPIIYWEGERREFLMDVRNGKFTYDELMEKVDVEMEALEKAKEISTIPNKVNQEKINQLYQELINV